jgi:hypothetical protein
VTSAARRDPSTIVNGWTSAFDLSATATVVSTRLEVPDAADVPTIPRDWSVYVVVDDIPVYTSLADQVAPALRMEVEPQFLGGAVPDVGFEFVGPNGACVHVVAPRLELQVASSTRTGGLQPGSPTSWTGRFWVGEGRPRLSWVTSGAAPLAGASHTPAPPTFWTGRFRVFGDAASVDVLGLDAASPPVARVVLAAAYPLAANTLAGLSPVFTVPAGLRFAGLVNNDVVQRSVGIAFEVYR